MDYNSVKARLNHTVITVSPQQANIAGIKNKQTKNNDIQHFVQFHTNESTLL